MSTFDIRNDSPGLLRAESLEITLNFQRTSDTTGRISWNIPTPATGCTAETQAYCGIILTIDTTATSSSKLPTQGTVYQDDPTADVNLFAGDKLGTSLIVGAFYNDRQTTFLDITGLKPNTPYFVSGFPCDCQFRYYIEGVHAYSLDFKRTAGTSTPSTQVIQLNDTSGVNLTDFTGLMPGVLYDFSIEAGGVTPKRITPKSTQECDSGDDPVKYVITIDGANAQTHQDLINELNKQFGLLKGCPQGPFAPNTGSYYWNNQTKVLSQWDGSQYQPLSVIVQSASPDIVPIGTYWVDTDNGNTLNYWNGTAWIQPDVLTLTYDPTQPPCDTSYWFDGTDGYVWDGNAWCKPTIYKQSTDPSLGSEPPCGSYWFNTDSGTLHKWNDKYGTWIVTTAIEYNEDPNVLTPGTLWFNMTTRTLNQLDTPSLGWNQITNVSIAQTAPSTPAPGKYWFKPTTLQLFKRDVLNTTWEEQNYILLSMDPQEREYCQAWWDTSTDDLYEWDGVNSVWHLVQNFFQQPVDPTLPRTFDEGTLWYNLNDSLYVWENACFNVVEYINWPTDTVNNMVAGTIWFNPSTNVYSRRNVSNTAWDVLSPVISSSDPTSLPVGTYWYDTGSNALKQWNGASWVSLLFTTTPQPPANGSCWFDTSTNTVQVWDGFGWTLGEPLASVELNCHGNLIFTDSVLGSLSLISITDGTLFQSLDVPFRVLQPTPGSDGLSDVPTYDQLGVGTDGSADERYKLMKEIRQDLGYPVVDVELTQDQLNMVISKSLEELRSRSAIAYKRGFFFMRVNGNTQRYLLTNKTQEFNKIVQIMGIYRLTSSFLSSAHGAGVYGQIVLQHLYNMGTFDLLSYHIMAEYTKLMEVLFAGRLTFTWNEQKRELWILHRFPYQERMVLVEASVERTEQDIMIDRWCRPWVRRYATALARNILAEIRGKYSTLPGANGSISLNASDLRAMAKEEIDMCFKDLEDFISEMPEEYGMATTFLFG